MVESFVELRLQCLAPPRSTEVHLWRASLDLDNDVAPVMRASLSAEERLRAQHPHREVDRRRYAAGRGWLRVLLGGYLNVAAADVVVVRDQRGKPRVEVPGSADRSWLRFNLAHSGSVITFAVARNREVGVDVELVREVDAEAIARRSLSARQHEELKRLPRESRAGAFFAMWTHNEAYLKGLGTGLDGGDHDLDGTPGWSVTPFDVGPRYTAAVAVAGEGVDVPVVAQELKAAGLDGRLARS